MRHREVKDWGQTTARAEGLLRETWYPSRIWKLLLHNERRDCPRELAGPQGKDRGHRGAVPRDVTLSDEGRDGADSDESKHARTRCAGGYQGSVLERECEVGRDMVQRCSQRPGGTWRKTPTSKAGSAAFSIERRHRWGRHYWQMHAHSTRNGRARGAQGQRQGCYRARQRLYAGTRCFSRPAWW